MLAAVLPVCLVVYAALNQEKVYHAHAAFTVELSTANVMDFEEVMDTEVTNPNLLDTMRSAPIWSG